MPWMLAGAQDGAAGERREVRGLAGGPHAPARPQIARTSAEHPSPR